jgi:hypothetical protein
MKYPYTSAAKRPNRPGDPRAAHAPPGEDRTQARGDLGLDDQEQQRGYRDGAHRHRVERYLDHRFRQQATATEEAGKDKKGLERLTSWRSAGLGRDRDEERRQASQQPVSKGQLVRRLVHGVTNYYSLPVPPGFR